MDKRLWNYSYLEYIRKAVEKTGPMCSKYSGECTLQLSACNNPKCRTQHQYWITLQTSQLDRDFYAGSLKEIKHLIHIDKKPNFGLKSARLEIYKVSITIPYSIKWFGDPLQDAFDGLSGLDNIFNKKMLRECLAKITNNVG